MTPSARVAAAIDVLDRIAEGLAAEQALTRWARQSRFAGSKDRAAVRDHVFDVLRKRDTAVKLGKGETGRALMMGLLRAAGANLEDMFTGEGYGPDVLTPEEKAVVVAEDDFSARWNLPVWLEPEFQRSLDDKAQDCALILQQRAPVCLRVNLRQTTREDAVSALRNEGIETEINTLSPSALTVIEGARRIRGSASFADGLVELQDAASQAVVDALPEGTACLDYCAGGGGKALAMAVGTGRQVFAHDIDPNRMKDLAPRAARAGCQVTALETSDLAENGPFDLVLCDAPCSGSGAWRRAPEGKWTLTQDRLDALCALQDEILDKASHLVRPKGVLAYATCSVLRCENEDRMAAFVAAHPEWSCTYERRIPISADGDGFFTAHLTRG